MQTNNSVDFVKHIVNTIVSSHTVDNVIYNVIKLKFWPYLTNYTFNCQPLGFECSQRSLLLTGVDVVCKLHKCLILLCAVHCGTARESNRTRWFHMTVFSFVLFFVLGRNLDQPLVYLPPHTQLALLLYIFNNHCLHKPLLLHTTKKLFTYNICIVLKNRKRLLCLSTCVQFQQSLLA